MIGSAGHNHKAHVIDGLDERTETSSSLSLLISATRNFDMRYIMIIAAVATSLGGCNPLETRPSGNANVPQPAKPVE